jgi:hypothetical protein
MVLCARIIKAITKFVLDQPGPKSSTVVESVGDDLDAIRKEHSYGPKDADRAMKETACIFMVDRKLVAMT